MKHSFWFICLVLAASMLMVFRIEIDGKSILPLFLLVIAIAWTVMDGISIAKKRYKVRRKYYRLDIIVGVMSLMEIIEVIVNISGKGITDYSGYSHQLLMISLTLFYFLITRENVFRPFYLDLILYSGLLIMSVLLLGNVASTQVGAYIRFWQNPVETASYLMLIGVIATVQFSGSNEKMQLWFYGLTAELSFILLAINQETVSLWTMLLVLLIMPIILRPTGILCKRVAQLVFLLEFTLSVVALVANYGKLFQIECTFDLEHYIYLDILLALGGILYFTCMDRLPEDVDLNKVQMKGLYRIDRRVVSIMAVSGFLLMWSGSIWEELPEGIIGVRVIRSFTVPFWQSVGQQKEILKQFVEQNGIAEIGFLIIIGIFMGEWIRRRYSWNYPLHGRLCIVAIALLLQLLLGQFSENTFVVMTILTVYAMGFEEREQKVKIISGNRKKKSEEI